MWSSLIGKPQRQGGQHEAALAQPSEHRHAQPSADHLAQS
jgi:hypothetical protein